MAAVKGSSFTAPQETERSTEVLATVPEEDVDGETIEMYSLGEKEPDSPTHDKSTATLIKKSTIRRGAIQSRKFSGLEAEVDREVPERWIMSDIFKQKDEELQVRLLALSFLPVRYVI